MLTAGGSHEAHRDLGVSLFSSVSRRNRVSQFRRSLSGYVYGFAEAKVSFGSNRHKVYVGVGHFEAQYANGNTLAVNHLLDGTGYGFGKQR